MLDGKSSYECTSGLLTLWTMGPSPNLPDPLNSHWGSSPLPEAGGHFPRGGRRRSSLALSHASPGTEKEGSCLRPRPEIQLKEGRHLQALASPSRAEDPVGVLPREFLWLLEAISRSVTHRVSRSLGGSEAPGAMCCLGRGCRWGAAVGISPSCHCLPTPGDQIPFRAAAIHTGWPLACLLRQRHGELPRRLTKAEIPSEEGGPLLSPRLLAPQGLHPSGPSANWARSFQAWLVRAGRSGWDVGWRVPYAPPSDTLYHQNFIQRHIWTLFQA